MEPSCKLHYFINVLLLLLMYLFKCCVYSMYLASVCDDGGDTCATAMLILQQLCVCVDAGVRTLAVAT